MNRGSFFDVFMGENYDVDLSGFIGGSPDFFALEGLDKFDYLSFILGTFRSIENYWSPSIN